MAKRQHEIRDPIHVFVKLDTDERAVVDSLPIQRLRHIHQLALTYLIYPGATHRRFEHSLGVMELASRIFDVVTAEPNQHEGCRDLFPDKDAITYWRRVLRMAALCHDIGHLPFSHAAEKELLPEGWTHETLTAQLIKSEEMEAIWNSITPPLRSDDIVKLAVGQKDLPKDFQNICFDDWETILSEIIVGNAFGADRIDYLLRDSMHAGVAYGRFDHHRLIDTLRILPREDKGSSEPALGIEEGGIHTAEGLILARHFMFSQLYCHPVRRIYDIHLKDFLLESLPGGKYPTDLSEHLRTTDARIQTALDDALHAGGPGAVHADRIQNRKHFRRIYCRHPDDIRINPDSAKLVAEAATAEFGAENVRLDSYVKNAGLIDFPVMQHDANITSSYTASKILEEAPDIGIEFVFVEPSIKSSADNWLKNNRDDIITPFEGATEGEDE